MRQGPRCLRRGPARSSSSSLTAACESLSASSRLLALRCSLHSSTALLATGLLATSTRFPLRRNLVALLAGLRKSDRNHLLPALYLAALSATSPPQRSILSL